MLKKLIEDLEDVRTAIVSRDLKYAELKLMKMIVECKQSAQQSFAADGFTAEQVATIRTIARDVAFSESPE